MINKMLFQGLKVHKLSSTFTLQQASVNFPIILVNLLRMMTIPFGGGMFNLKFTPEAYYKFIQDMGKAISTHEFDYLDNVVLSLLLDYHIPIPETPLHIIIPELYRNNFVEKCNDFKGKKWNDILNEFVEELIILLDNCYINNTKIIIGY